MVKIEAFEKTWEVRDITRKQRRRLHHLNRKVYATSKFEFSENGKDPRLVQIITDHDVLGNLLDETLNLAFENPSELDTELTDDFQDGLARIILDNYLSLSKKKNGD